MIQILLKRLIPDQEHMEEKQIREKVGVLSGVLGICCNLLLFGVKLAVGMVMNSIAVVSDAFNNLSDSGSSVVSIISAKMSNRRPDREHPYGHGRIEYISALIVSFLIMLVGLELLKGSFDKVLHPQGISFSWLSVGVLLGSVAVKLWMFSYNRYLGKLIGSSVLKATARDSINDAVSTGAVLICTVVGFFSGLSLDGYVGLLVAIFILYGGFSLAKETVSVLLGNPADPGTVKAIVQHLKGNPCVAGVHDLMVHDYGPGRVLASVHAEVPDDSDIVQVHEMIDAMEQEIEQDLGIHIVIHMDPIAVHSPVVKRMRELVGGIVSSLCPGCSIHDFRMTNGENRINLIFDLAVPCEMSGKEREELCRRVEEQVTKQDPRCRTVITVENCMMG